MPKLSIHGHAANRVFTYNDNGVHNEFAAPGGAALIAQILHGKGLADAATLGKSHLREHLELAGFYDKQSKTVYHAIGRRSGITPGTARIDTEPAPYALLWGAEFDILPVPAETPTLWASNEGLPDEDLLAEIAGRCFLMLDADVLRSAGAMISRQISWERTASELVWQLQNNPALSYLLQAKFLLVTFAEDGAVYLAHEGDRLTASLTLTHGDGEGSLRDTAQGQIDDAFIVMTAAAALQFEDVIYGDKKLRVLPILKTAQTLIASGYDARRLKQSEFELISAEDEGREDKRAEDGGREDKRAEDEDGEDKRAGGGGAAAESAFIIPVDPGRSVSDTDSWCISNSVSNRHIFDIALAYVLDGPEVIEGLPRLSFGALTTVDRWEIEAFQNIRNLIISYANSTNTNPKPLSIAVFGSPGSGKSFGVTQIANNILPGKVEKLEFNVSQFTGPNDLSAAFHKVRDAILEGKLPLVFFDEFDSLRDELPLGWIKSFLMPMQDGKFKDESGEHPLGKCILVFAGGTASGFEEFARPMHSGSSEEQQKFKNVKGPDFVSRLRGTINVLGPNPKDESDNNYILRRALLLRSLCERKLEMKKKGGAPISRNIVWAMLLVPKYSHGARSMEAILDMSRIEGNVWEPVSLPFHSQLSLHVDADAFVKLVLREAILYSYIEDLARAAHESYVKELRAAGKGSHSSAVEWDVLPEDLRNANRAQARHIAEHFSKTGFAYDSGDTPFPSVEEFDEETTLMLAKNEHARWMNERRSAGWVYGPKRDNGKKIHDLLVEWDRLPDVEKKKDIDVTKNIIPMLKGIGLRVYRTV